MIKLTFDDGLLNTFEVAFPIMEKYGVKAVVFIPTAFVGSCVSFRRDRSPHMTVDQLRILYKAGWEIGSHSHSHPRFDQISLEKADSELKTSKTHLENWGFNPVSFAFPYGHGFYTKEQVDLAFNYYAHVRTVTAKNPYPSLEYAVPLDDFPEAHDHEVYVIHLVRNLISFETWIKTNSSLCARKL